MAEKATDMYKTRNLNIPTYMLDADGIQVAIETREDEEQYTKYQEIIDTLISAGYFRAKITGLSPFDKVIGGMTWCIDTSQVDIDVELLFEDNLSIGQKISLTEKIVVVLPKIQCPYFIEPHQIQGLDFIHIFPVIQWLVKWSSENRARKAKYLQVHALNYFYKCFSYPIDEGQMKLEKAVSNIVAVENLYSPPTGENENLLITEKYKMDRKCELLENNLKELEEEKGRLRIEIEKELKIEEENSKREQTEISLDHMSEDELKNVKLIQSLMMERDQLKEQETAYKEKRKIKLSKLQSEIEELKQVVAEMESKDDYETQLKELQGKLAIAKQELSNETKLLSSKGRKADQVPSRAELTQYQRRFLELYNQVAVKHKETKQYYSMYNTLNDKYHYLQKEFKLLDSMQENYTQALTSSRGREEFFNQFSAIVSGIEQTKLKVEQNKNDQLRNKERLMRETAELEEKKRFYISSVKEFSIICTENEKFRNEIHKLSGTS